MLYQAHLGKEEHDHRQFEGDTKGEQEPHGQSEIFFHGGQGRYFVCGEAEEELEPQREHHVEGKGRTHKEKHGGDEYEWQDVLLFPLIQTWHHKFPDLVKDYRCR